ncbi:hypothetical protein KAX75_02055 [candidate division WOR-3 bacterium]|nr:hypothetical protein [candidate division WOR-3 bacterium]
MKKNIHRKLLKAASILFFISGIFLLFLVISTLSHCTSLLYSLCEPGLNATIGLLEMFYLYEAALKYRIVIPLFFAGFALIDLLCSVYVLKGNKIFRWTAYVRSLFASFIGIYLIFDAFTNISISIIEGIVYLIYYGIIFILLIFSRKPLPSDMAK